MIPSVTLEDIQRARGVIAGQVHVTPVLSTGSLGRMVGCELLLKAENLQRAGSFKVRGAVNKIAGLSAEQKARGVIAASAGNHAQGVALAAGNLGIDCTIVMPRDASIPKVEATKGYGAEVVLHGESFDEAMSHANRLVQENGLTLVHAFDDPAVIAGQGTIGLELLEQAPDIDAVVVPVGGGGLIAGIGLAIRETMPGVRVIGVQASASTAFVESYRSDRRVSVKGEPTVADGIAVGTPGRLTLPLAERCVDDMVAVDEEEITQAMTLLLERCKLLVEGAGAVGLAALLGGKIPVDGQRVVVVLSGGNVDSNLVARVLEHGLSHAGRYMVLRQLIEDRPGRLSRLLAVVSGTGVNILQVGHLRHGPSVPMGHVEVQLELETRNSAHAEEVRERLRESGYSLTEE